MSDEPSSGGYTKEELSDADASCWADDGQGNKIEAYISDGTIEVHAWTGDEKHEAIWGDDGD